MTIANLFSMARNLVDATSTSLTDAVLLMRINQANEEIVNKILQADGTWQFDDANFTTNPVGKGDLVSGQNSYTFTNSFLEIEEIDILDLNGYYIRLTAIDPQELNGVSFEEHFNITFNGTSYVAQSGMPSCYDKVGKTITLDTAPTADYCTLTKGLRARFKRTADLFTSAEVTTGTKEPGFSINHHVLAYKIALPDAMKYKKDRVGLYVNEITKLENEIVEHYCGRQKDVIKKITLATRSYK